MTFTPRQNTARGFGALELLVVVVILGGILVLTLHGTAMIAPMRAQVVARQIYAYQSAVLHYLTDFRSLPGDDAGASRRWRRPEALYLINGLPVSYVADGKINGFLDDSASAAGEQYVAWNDLIMGGYVEGDKTLVGQSVRPENLYGGVYGFAEDNLGLDQVLCLTRVPGRDAGILDKNLDDGKIATGNLRGTSQWDPVEAKNHFTEPDKEPYDAEKTYIICLPDMP